MNNIYIGICEGFAKTAKPKLRPRVDMFIYNDKGEVLA